MTALAQYRRLETTGLWRDGEHDQRREVVVALGDATLVISSTAETALTHWSLPAVTRLNPGRLPALYGPGPGASEQLELQDPDMIDAIETLRSAIEKRRPHPGRLRLWIGLGFALVVLLAAGWWLPGALTRQTLTLLPEASRIDIGRQLLAEMTRLSGPPCNAPRGRAALNRLTERTFGMQAPRVVIVPSGIPETIALPGNLLVVHAALVEDHETPEILAGYMLAEEVRRVQADPMLTLLNDAGLPATFRLLTTGHIADDVLHAHAARLLGQPRSPVSDVALLAAFARAEISSEPYAFARDVSGETTLGLIEANPVRSTLSEPLLGDADWISLQDICTQ